MSLGGAALSNPAVTTTHRGLRFEPVVLCAGHGEVAAAGLVHDVPDGGREALGLLAAPR
jgi:hypothetical protein